MSQSKKNQDILNLIHIWLLKEEYKDSVLPGFIIPAIATYIDKHKNEIDIEKYKANEKQIIKTISDKVWDIIVKDEYLEQYIDDFDNLFIHDEIKYMIHYYTSNTMKKFNSKEGKKAYNNIFEGFRNITKKVIEKEKLMLKKCSKAPEKGSIRKNCS